MLNQPKCDTISIPIACWGHADYALTFCLKSFCFIWTWSVLMIERWVHRMFCWVHPATYPLSPLWFPGPGTWGGSPDNTVTTPFWTSHLLLPLSLYLQIVLLSSLGSSFDMILMCSHFRTFTEGIKMMQYILTWIYEISVYAADKLLSHEIRLSWKHPYLPSYLNCVSRSKWTPIS